MPLIANILHTSRAKTVTIVYQLLDRFQTADLLDLYENDSAGSQTPRGLKVALIVLIDRKVIWNLCHSLSIDS